LTVTLTPSPYSVQPSSAAGDITPQDCLATNEQANQASRLEIVSLAFRGAGEAVTVGAGVAVTVTVGVAVVAPEAEQEASKRTARAAALNCGTEREK